MKKYQYKRMNVYLTDEENDIIQTIADMANETRQETFKKMAFFNRKIFEEFRALNDIEPQLLAIIKESAAQGNNLNQMAKQLNETKTATPEILASIKIAENTGNLFYMASQELRRILKEVREKK